MTGPSTEDRLQIYELYARYSWALDTGDTEGYVALFTPDAEATEETREGGLEVRRGHDEIRKLVLKFHKRADFPGHQHQMAQLVFEADPDGRADHWVVRSYAWQRSIDRQQRLIFTGVGIFATSWRRSMASGRSGPRQSWDGRERFYLALEHPCQLSRLIR